MAVDTPSKVNLSGPIPPVVRQPLPEFLTTEESALKRHNRNQELPLALATAVGLHLFVLICVAVAGVVWISFGPGKPPPTEFVDVAAFDPNVGTGAKGNEGGFKDATQPPQENYHYADTPKETGPLEFTPLPDFAGADLPKIGADPDPRTTTLRSRGDKEGARPGPPGNDDTPGIVGAPNRRPARTQRWEIVLPMQDSQQFLRKLTELEALVLVPDAGQYRLFDLTKKDRDGKPATRADVNRLNRIWYTNRMPVVCQGIADELGLAYRPEFFAIFIPQSLEAEMLKKELAHRQLTEEQVVAQKLQTQFEVARRPGGWDVKVRKQEPRKD